MWESLLDSQVAVPVLVVYVMTKELLSRTGLGRQERLRREQQAEVERVARMVERLAEHEGLDLR